MKKQVARKKVLIEKVLQELLQTMDNAIFIITWIIEITFRSFFFYYQIFGVKELFKWNLRTLLERQQFEEMFLLQKLRWLNVNDV